jgi:hypothetical protein
LLVVGAKKNRTLLGIGIFDIPVKQGIFGGEKSLFPGKKSLFSAKFAEFQKGQISL